MSIEVMKKVMGLIQKSRDHYGCDDFQTEAMDELRDAVTELEKQKPIGWFHYYGQVVNIYTQDLREANTVSGSLYLQPLRKAEGWVGLTDDERMMCRSYDVDEAILNTETKLKEKNKCK